MENKKDKRFEYNDKWARYLYWILFIFTTMEICATIVGGFITIFLYNVFYGILIILFGWIIPLIIYIFIRTLLGICVDIKYIRNKIYNEDNNEIESWWSEH